MRKIEKAPVGLTGIADLMEMKPEEIRAWPYFKDVQMLMKDYNYGTLVKDSLIAKLMDISAQCANKGIYHYSEGIDNAISAIRVCY